MFELPPEPVQGSTISADWGRKVVRALRAYAPRGGRGIRVDTLSGGTTYSLAGDDDSPSLLTLAKPWQPLVLLEEIQNGEHDSLYRLAMKPGLLHYIATDCSETWPAIEGIDDDGFFRIPSSGLIDGWLYLVRPGSADGKWTLELSDAQMDSYDVVGQLQRYPIAVVSGGGSAISVSSLVYGPILTITDRIQSESPLEPWAVRKRGAIWEVYSPHWFRESNGIETYPSWWSEYSEGQGYSGEWVELPFIPKAGMSLYACLPEDRYSVYRMEDAAIGNASILVASWQQKDDGTLTFAQHFTGMISSSLLPWAVEDFFIYPATKENPVIGSINYWHGQRIAMKTNVISSIYVIDEPDIYIKGTPYTARKSVEVDGNKLVSRYTFVPYDISSTDEFAELKVVNIADDIDYTIADTVESQGSIDAHITPYTLLQRGSAGESTTKSLLKTEVEAANEITTYESEV